MANQKLYWHFARTQPALNAEGRATHVYEPRLGYGDKRLIKPGITLTVKGEPIICFHGLHATYKALHALSYVSNDANPVQLCQVTVGGKVVKGTKGDYYDNDKLAATERTVQTMLTIEQTNQLLYEFAFWCALKVSNLWGMSSSLRTFLITAELGTNPSQSVHDAILHAHDNRHLLAVDGAFAIQAAYAAVYNYYPVTEASRAHNTMYEARCARVEAEYRRNPAKYRTSNNSEIDDKKYMAMEDRQRAIFVNEFERRALAAIEGVQHDRLQP